MKKYYLNINEMENVKFLIEVSEETNTINTYNMHYNSQGEYIGFEEVYEYVVIDNCLDQVLADLEKMTKSEQWEEYVYNNYFDYFIIEK